MRMWLLGVSACAVLGACKGSDVADVRGERPADVKPGFSSVGRERWQVTRVDADGSLWLKRVDVNTELETEIERTAGSDRDVLTLSAAEIEQFGGQGIKNAEIREGDVISIIRSENKSINRLELETTRDDRPGD